MDNNINVAVGGPVNADYPKVYKTKFLKPGISFGLQVTEQNTKYVIKHNFDLGGEEITIPENCVLEFDGGSLSNCIISGNNTIIQADLVKIFNIDVTLSGSWNVLEAYPEWFGAKGDGVTDDIGAIQKTLDTFTSNNIPTKLSSKTYCISKPIIIWGENNLNEERVFVGNGIDSTVLKKITNSTTNVADNDVDCIIAIINSRFKDSQYRYSNPDYADVRRVIIKNINITNSGTNSEYGIYGLCSHYSIFEQINISKCNKGFRFVHYNYLNAFKTINIEFPEIGFYFGDNKHGSDYQTTLHFEDCHINGGSNTCFYLEAGAVLINCTQDGGTACFIKTNTPLGDDDYKKAGNITAINPHIETISAVKAFDINGGVVNIVEGVIMLSKAENAILFYASKAAKIIVTDIYVFPSDSVINPSLKLFKSEKMGCVNIQSIYGIETAAINDFHFIDKTNILYDGVINKTEFLHTTASSTITEQNGKINIKKIDNEDISLYVYLGRINISEYNRIIIVASAENISNYTEMNMLVSDTVDSNGLPVNPTQHEIGVQPGTYNNVSLTHTNFNRIVRTSDLVGTNIPPVGEKHCFIRMYSNTTVDVDIYRICFE